MKNKAFLIPLLLWLALFVVLPFVLIIYYGLTVESENGVIFSLENFTSFGASSILVVLAQSLKVALYATLLCLVLGYPVAYILARSDLKHKNMLLLLIMLPMWMNFLLRTYSWLSLLENTGLINTLLSTLGLGKVKFLYNEGAVVFGTFYNYLPFMIMPIQVALIKLDESLLEAASDLGANPVKRFLRITLPYSVPGILSGIAMVFVPSVTTFVISQIMSGGKVMLIGDVIEQQFRKVNDWHFGSTISLMVMVVVLAFMYAINRGDMDDGEASVIP